jgi:predicted GNAT superfamily acetyltransferase
MIELRDIAPEDREWLHALNVACLPAVNDLAIDALWRLVGKTVSTRVALLDGKPAGATMTLGPGTPHDSVNYLWFDRRMADFLYLDRIMVEESARGAGIGKALYRDVFRIAGALPGIDAVTCEVNLRPFNGGSLRLHAALGFVTVGEQETEGGKKAVSLLRRPVGAYP